MACPAPGGGQHGIRGSKRQRIQWRGVADSGPIGHGSDVGPSAGCGKSAKGGQVKSFASVEGGILFGNGMSDCKGPIPGWINQYKMDPTVSYATGEKAEQFFVTLDSDASPQAYDAPNPCVVYTGKAPLVWCTPDGAMHTWPPCGTDAIKRFFATL